MTDFGQPSQRLLDACSRGDIPVIQALIDDLDIASGLSDGQMPLSERRQASTELFMAAIQGQQVEALNLLSKKFPKHSLYGRPVLEAMRTGNQLVLAVVCKIDPSVANTETGDDSCLNALGEACSHPNAAELVKVLLDAGADPNLIPPFRLPGCWNVSAAVNAGLPASTFEQYFNAGYDGYDAHAVELAVQHKRRDILEVLFRRSKSLPNARWPSEEALTEIAKANRDADMVAVIKRMYPASQGTKPGFFATLMSKLRS